MRNRRGKSPAARLAAFHVPKCSMTVCGWTRASGSCANSRIVGERPSLRGGLAQLVEDLVVGVAAAETGSKRGELRLVDRQLRACQASAFAPSLQEA